MDVKSQGMLHPDDARHELPASGNNSDAFNTLPQDLRHGLPAGSQPRTKSRSRSRSRASSRLSDDTSSDDSSSDSDSEDSHPSTPPPAYSPMSENGAPPSPRALDAAEFHMPHLTSSSGMPHPIAIPATSKKLGSAFLRAYPPNLERYHISREEFLKFLDDLNRAMVKSPPLEVLSLAGTVVGFVPISTAQIVGNSVEAAATLGSYALSKGRTEYMIRDVNKKTFRPRGLQIQIAKLDALAKLAEIPILDSAGKVKKDAPVFQAMDPAALRRYSSGDQKYNAQQRRLDALKQYIAPLDLEPLPELATPKNPLSKWSAKVSERDRAKAERKMEKKQAKAARRHQKRSNKAARKMDRDLDDNDRRLYELRGRQASGQDPAQMEEQMARIHREKGRIEQEYDARMDKTHQKRQKKDRDEKTVRKILWLIITEVEGEGHAPALGEGRATSTS